MIGPGEVFVALIIVGLPTIMLMLLVNRYFRLREKKLEVEAGLAAEKAAQYASRTHELEQRLRVVEQIVTDRGLETASQIEALRDRKRIASEETR
jgi:ABC-type phosphate transport system auxiliary subunit